MYQFCFPCFGVLVPSLCFFQVRSCLFSVVAGARSGARAVGRAAVDHPLHDAGAGAGGDQGGAVRPGGVLRGPPGTGFYL